MLSAIRVIPAVEQKSISIDINRVEFYKDDHDQLIKCRFDGIESLKVLSPTQVADFTALIESMINPIEDNVEVGSIRVKPTKLSQQNIILEE